MLFTLILNFGLLFCGGVLAEKDYEVKKGVFPYMAFLYYTDESILNTDGSRYIQSAILVKNNWLLSAAVDDVITNDGRVGFPQKTLMARVGALNVDPSMPLNEDENEQEKEINQIVRPYGHNADSALLTDISLLKTLIPFQTTASVSPTSLIYKNTILEKSCSILVYAKLDKKTEQKSLLKFSVELLNSKVERCGNDFHEKTMVCAAGTNDTKTFHDSSFCVGNAGGPLICQGELSALQSYLNYQCQEPFMFQLLQGWETFISCGIVENCEDVTCNKVCKVTNKDEVKLRNDDSAAVAPDTTIPASVASTGPASSNSEVPESVSDKIPKYDIFASSSESSEARPTMRVDEGKSTVKDNVTSTLAINNTAATSIPTTEQTSQQTSDATMDPDSRRKANIEAQVEAIKPPKIARAKSGAAKHFNILRGMVFIIVNMVAAF